MAAVVTELPETREEQNAEKVEELPENNDPVETKKKKKKKKKKKGDFKR
jgi:hypothetical protein